MPGLWELSFPICMTSFNFQLMLELMTKLDLKDYHSWECRVFYNLVTLKDIVNMPYSGFFSFSMEGNLYNMARMQAINAVLLILDLYKIC